MPPPIRCAALLLLVSVACPAQTFKNVDYLYRANDKATPKHVDGSIVIDSAQKTLTFTSIAKYASGGPGGTSSDMPWTQVKHQIDKAKATRQKPAKLQLLIASSSATSASYERTSTPRYAAGLLIAWPLLFTKEKRHFLTLQYKGDNGAGKYAIFQLDKGNYLECLAAVEATMGVKIERIEEH